MRLGRVELVEGAQPYLRFDAMMRTNAGSVRERLTYVLVPTGREDEARRLVERFGTEVVS